MQRQHRPATGRYQHVTLLEQRVPCSLAPGGLHPLTIALSVEGVVTHLSAPCAHSLTSDAVERMGGVVCIDVLARMREFLDGEGTMDALAIYPLLQNAARMAAERRGSIRTKRYSPERATGLDTRRMDIAALITARIQTQTHLPLEVRWMSDIARWEMRYTDTTNRRTTLAERSWSAQVWQYDEPRFIEYVASRSYAPFGPAEAKLRRDRSPVEKENNFCRVCNRKLNQKSGHLKTTKHIDAMCVHVRRALQAFPGPRRSR